MPEQQKNDVHHKALSLNLDPTKFGSFAEIGAGQEVARWFLTVGGASGTVAKTISAYDKEVSDDLYGAADLAALAACPAGLLVQSVNEPGTLAQITQVIAEHDGNIDNIRMTRQSPDFTELTIDLEVYNLKHLTSIISQLRAKKVVAAAERVNG